MTYRCSFSDTFIMYKMLHIQILTSICIKDLVLCIKLSYVLYLVWLIHNSIKANKPLSRPAFLWDLMTWSLLTLLPKAIYVRFSVMKFSLISIITSYDKVKENWNVWIVLRSWWSISVKLTCIALTHILPQRRELLNNIATLDL